MKPVLAALVLLASALAPAVAFAEDTTAGTLSGGVSTMAPAFTEEDITGKQTVSLESYRGKVVMLNFWGPWCQPCLTEVPELKKLQAKYKGKLVIVGAAVFSSDDAVDLFYTDFSINYPVIHGSYDLMDKYGRISVFPTTIVIDRKGVIAARLVGSGTTEQFETALKPLLAE
jgi:cytochrome c biogenesis protein CcmG, thiol:disulfide interchange protein DsbE